jgi:hypothetical protein
MSVPTWSGDEHTLGTFRNRVLWVRLLLVAGVTTGLVGAFGMGHTVGQRDSRPERDAPARSPLSLELTTAKLDAATPALGGPEGTLVWSDCDDDDGPTAALTQAEERALEAESRARCARIQAAQEAQEVKSQAVYAQLESAKLSLNFDETPIGEVFDFLRDVTKLNYVVTSQARDLIEDESIKVSLRLEDISLSNSIKLILAAHEELRFRVRRGVVLIETSETEPELELAAYAVEDIVSGRLQGKGGVSLSPDSLVELIEEELTAHLLSFEGSLEYTAGMEGQKGTLIARRAPSEHVKIRELLSYLRDLKRTTPSEPKWIAHYRSALKSRRVTLDFQETPLSDVINFIQDITGLNLTIASDVDSDQIEVTIRLREVLLEEALGLILEQSELAHSFVNETLLIHDVCDSSHASYNFEVVDVRDLSSWMEPDQIQELVEKSIGEEFWDEPSSIQVHRGQLLVRQTQAQHEKIREFLAKLRCSRAQSATKTK